MAGAHETSPKNVAIIARFVRGLPNKPDAIAALGFALRALYNTPLPPNISGSYTLTSAVQNGVTTRISIAPPAEGLALVKSTDISPVHRLHDGVLVSPAPDECMMLLRDRLMLSPRYIVTKGLRAFVTDQARSMYEGKPDFPWYHAAFARE
jgi:hypothetical protein